LCKERQSEALTQLDGRFWEPSGRASDEVGKGEAGDEEEEAWWAEVKQELQILATVQVQEGLGADDLFHIYRSYTLFWTTQTLY